MNRRAIAAGWIGAIAATVVLTLHPVNGGIVRVAWLFSVVSVLVFPLVLWPRSRRVRTAVVVCIATPLLLLALPGRRSSRASLRMSSVAVLRSFEGTRYVWGGEGRLGIDCSGLVRQALIRSSLKQGLSSFDGELLRLAASTWWFDSSARALRDGYRAQTIVILRATAANEIPPDRLLPGDFAVTSDGRHVLAYLGSGQWIEADPDLGRVVTAETPTTNSWFTVPVHVMRWTALAE